MIEQYNWEVDMADRKVDNPASAFAKIMDQATKYNVEKAKFKNELLKERLKRKGGMEDFALKETFKGEQAQVKAQEKRGYEEEQEKEERAYDQSQADKENIYKEDQARQKRKDDMSYYYEKQDYLRENPKPNTPKAPPQENYAKIAKVVNNLRLKEKTGTLSGEEAEYLHILENKFYGKDKEASAWDQYGEAEVKEQKPNDEYELDAVYEDEDGRKAKYLGGGEWEIQ